MPINSYKPDYILQGGKIVKVYHYHPFIHIPKKGQILIYQNDQI